MDVHDTDEMSRSITLQPGMVVTIEPGVFSIAFINSYVITILKNSSKCYVLNKLVINIKKTTVSVIQCNKQIHLFPGLYLPESCTHIPQEFRGLGVRIEDDVLINEHGYTNLTAHCPRHPDDIEAVMKH